MCFWVRVGRVYKYTHCREEKKYFDYYFNFERIIGCELKCEHEYALNFFQVQKKKKKKLNLTFHKCSRVKKSTVLLPKPNWY